MNYTALAATALRLLQDHGRQLTFTATSRSTYSPATGTYSETTSDYSKYAVVTQYKASELSDSILNGDLKVIAESYDYGQGDTVSIDGDDYRIMDIKKLKPSDTEVAVILQVRK